MNRRNFLRGSATVGAAVVAVKAMPNGVEIDNAQLIAEIPEPDYTMATTIHGPRPIMFTAPSAPSKDRGMATPLSERDWWHRG